MWISPQFPIKGSICCYTQWSKSEREKQILYIDAYIWNLERWYWLTYLQGRNRDADIENRLVYTVGKERVGWTESSTEAYTPLRVKQIVVVQLLNCVHSLWPRGLQHARPPYPSLSPWVCSNSCPLSQWCHKTISSSFAPFSCPQSFSSIRSFPVGWLFASGGQSIWASTLASVLLINI